VVFAAPAAKSWQWAWSVYTKDENSYVVATPKPQSVISTAPH